MTTRSTSAAVRNPIASDPRVADLVSALHPGERAALREFLLILSRSWRVKAEHSWRTHKPPMAAYWKQNAVNARHLAGALKVKP